MANIADVIRKPRKKIAHRQAELRTRLWPGLNDSFLWLRQKHDGFTTIPRTLPLIMTIMDDMAGTGKPVSSTYLELWCRAFDECFVTLSRPREMAFHAGFTGQRGERTWRARMRILAELQFIALEGGPSGEMSYALILNPYLVIRRWTQMKHPGVRLDKYNALMERAVEISAGDLDLPDPWLAVGTPAPIAETAMPAAPAA